MKKTQGFTLVELLITVAIVGIVSVVAVPSYQSHSIRASRSAAQTELIQLAGLQEKIYLNSSSYSIAAITAAYTGNSTGGLGATTGGSVDKKYTYACVCNAQDFSITATPVGGQAADGSLTITSTGQRLWTGGQKATW